MDHPNCCPACALNTVVWVEVDQTFPYGDPCHPDFAHLTVRNVPVGMCSACEFSFTDSRGEKIRTARVQEYLDELVRNAQNPTGKISI